MANLRDALSQVAPDHMAAVPGAPQMKIRELEEENMHLSRQVKQLHRQLLETRSALRPDIDQRSATPPTFDDGMVECDSDVVKLRRTVEESDDLYMVRHPLTPTMAMCFRAHQQSQTSGSSRMSSSPQLVSSIPAEDPHDQYTPHSPSPYQEGQTTMDYEQTPQASGATSYGLSYQYQMPVSPSSSTTSSPTTSFSASVCSVSAPLVVRVHNWQLCMS